MSADRRIIWIVPEREGGIRTYADGLMPSMARAAGARGWAISAPLYDLPAPEDIRREHAEGNGLLIHVQHEFGLFGSKVPGFHRFPGWLSEVRRRVPLARVVATAHAVITPDFRYPLRGRGWQIPFRLGANLLLLPWFKRVWREGTWSRLDGVIVHSRLQIEAVGPVSGRPAVEIPHYVYASPDRSPAPGEPIQRAGTAGKRIVVFGYLSPEKGQDLAIEAMGRLGKMGIPATLVLAGGIRRGQDQWFLRACRNRVDRLGLQGSVEVTGFVPDDAIDDLYRTADLVLAPFRDTSGSGSVAMALARGAPILGSDHPLNREIAERQSGAMEFFRSGDVDDLAEQVARILRDETLRRRMSEAGRAYARALAPENVAQRHADFYAAVWDQIRESAPLR